MKHKKKILFLLTVVLIFLFPEQIFSGFAGMMILLLIVFLVVEVALDVYIVVAFFLQNHKDKKKK